MTQLPSLFGVPGGGHNFFERLCCWPANWARPTSRACGRCHRDHAARVRRALAARKAGCARRRCVVDHRCNRSWASRARGAERRDTFRRACRALEGPALRLRDVEGIVPLAAGCLLLAYIEGVSAARTFAAKHGYALDPRQELLGIGAANLAAALGHGYPVAGGLSQSAVNDKAGARTPLALVFASMTLALCLLFLTGRCKISQRRYWPRWFSRRSGLFDFPALSACGA